MRTVGFLVVIAWLVGGLPSMDLVHAEGKGQPALSPDGATAATCHEDGTVKLWNLDTGTVRTTLYQPLDPRFAERFQVRWTPLAIFSPDGKYVATSRGYDPTILWEVSSAKEVARLEGQAVISSLMFSQNGKFLISLGDKDKISGHNMLAVWDLATKKELILVRNPHGVEFSIVRIAPSKATLMALDTSNTVTIWDLNTGREIRRIRLPMESDNK